MNAAVGSFVIKEVNICSIVTAFYDFCTLKSLKSSCPAPRLAALVRHRGMDILGLSPSIIVKAVNCIKKKKVCVMIMCIYYLQENHIIVD